MIFTIERTGQFPVGWHHSHDHQCGNVGQQILTYRVKIWCQDHLLCEDGWILDNNEFPTYFHNKYKDVSDFISCEHIAKRACIELTDKCFKLGSHPYKIEAGVSGIPGSEITCTLEHRQYSPR